MACERVKRTWWDNFYSRHDSELIAVGYLTDAACVVSGQNGRYDVLLYTRNKTPVQTNS